MSPTPTPTTTANPHPCATAYALYKAGFLTQAESQYSALLTPSSGVSARRCAVKGLKKVAQKRRSANWWAARGDMAAAAGDLNLARADYRKALRLDHGNQAAAGLQKLNKQPPNSIRQARDHWNQIVTNTLVPLGQFFLWLAAVFVAIYILYLLTRFASRWLRLPEKPLWRSTLKNWARLVFGLAVVAGILSVVIGVTHRLPHGWPVGGLWVSLLILAGVLVLAGCSLMAWHLRSGSGVQFTVTSVTGSSDDPGRAMLAGRLDSLGAKPPRGFDLPQETDVTSLTGVIALLPGGGMLSALVSFLLMRVPATPWQATVTLIDDDQLLVTLHRNGRPLETVLANRASLFFPALVAGQDTDNTSGYVKTIDRPGMLTVAAAIILVTMAMADPDSPLRTGLNGATRWESVAGQVLATGPGFSGDEGLSQALLDRAVDVDPDNMAAQVAKIVLRGRRAADPDSRRDFAEQISEIARWKLNDPGYEVLRLRAVYSSAAGWCNVYLDSRRDQDWQQARACTVDLVKYLCDMADAEQAADPNPQHPDDAMITYMKAAAYILWTSLNTEKPAAASLARIDTIVRAWRPTDAATARGAYDQACLASQDGRRDEALRYLKLAAVDDDLRIWARRDPSFTKLRAQAPKEFTAIVADPPPDSFINLGPLSGYAGPLSDIGVHTAADLRIMTSTDAELHLFARAIGVSQLVVERWRNIAILSNLSPDGPDFGQLDLLVAVGVDSPEELRAQTATEAKVASLHGKLVAAGPDHQVTVPDQDALKHWAQLARRRHGSRERRRELAALRDRRA